MQLSKTPPRADAMLLRQLADWQREELRRPRTRRELMNEVELPLVRILRDMELAGLKLDTERLGAISELGQGGGRRLEQEIFELADEEFMLGSPRQLEEILFGKLGLSRKRRGKTGYSTDARVLQAIRDEHAIVPKIERWRELTKLAQTYLDALPLLIAADGRIHTTFNQTAAATGRLSSNSPNLQNIPIRTALGREIRACFIAEPGNLLVERRLLTGRAAAACADRRRGRAQGDLPPRRRRPHGDRHARVRRDRRPDRSGHALEVEDDQLRDRLRPLRLRDGRPAGHPQEEADEFIQRYLAGFPAVERFIDETIEQGTEHGYVSTLFGRRRQVPELRARRWEMRKQGERFAVNMVIQGTAADVMKVAMVRTHDALASEGLRPGWCFRSTTSSCSRDRPPRPTRSGSWRSGRWRRRSRWIRRWLSRRASAATG